MIDWKALFSAMGVDWRDRGPNTTRNDVNICCPFCGDDYGYHLGVSITGSTKFYCFRNSEHGGRSPVFLLHALGATRKEADELIAEYGNGEEAPAEKSPPSPASITKKWRNFSSAVWSSDCLDYLRGRGFEDPKKLAQKYDLRFSPEGKWARRVMMPVKLNGEVVSWTARSIDDGRIPKYLMQSVVFPGLVYVPRVSTDIMVAVEGPLDALKICGAEMGHVGALALMGKALNARKLIILTKLLKGVRKLVFAPDADVDVVARERMRNLLKVTRLGQGAIPILVPPDPFKDAGAMPYRAIRQWVHTV